MLTTCVFISRRRLCIDSQTIYEQHTIYTSSRITQINQISVNIQRNVVRSCVRYDKYAANGRRWLSVNKMQVNDEKKQNIQMNVTNCQLVCDI
jgi:hypothetical protein